MAKSEVFPFLELPEELQYEIASFLDAPSSLSMSMASRHLRAKLFTSNGFFNNWVFLDETIKNGYCGLLKYAFEHGSPIEFRELVVSVMHNQSDIALWILSGPYPQDKLKNIFRQFLCKAAALDGNATLVNLIANDSVDSPDRLYLQGGHLHLLPKLFDSVKEGQNLPFVKSAAMGGHGDLAFKLCKNPANPTLDELRAIFLGATNGHPALMRQVLGRVASRGSTYSDFFKELPEPLKCSPEVLSVITEVHPDYFRLHIEDSHFFLEDQEPLSLETLKILKSINIDLAEFFSMHSQRLLVRCLLPNPSSTRPGLLLPSIHSHFNDS